MNAAAEPSLANRGLAILRERIAEVRRARAATRWTAALATLGLTLAGLTIAVFAIDWLFGLRRPGRAILLAAAAAALAWVWWRRVRPWTVVRESDLDLALIVERQQGVDSDLVAALQFERPEADAWGSGDLRRAVVDYVAEFGRDWEVPREVAGAAVRRRLAWLGAVLALIVAAVVWRPDFAAAFLNRVAFGSMHYPTRTRIESLVIGDTAVDPATGKPGIVKAPFGQPLEFRVALGGAVPDTAAVRLVSESEATETELPLASDAEGRTFTGGMPRLLESVRVQILAGDAWTDPVRVSIVPLPIVETTLSAQPPEYARTGAEAAGPPPAARQISVLEGSRVNLAVACRNKRLASAKLVVGAVEYPLVADAAGTWTLPAVESPLTRVVEPIQFEVRVQDEDGLAPGAPVVGSIRLRRDAPPQASAEVATRLVLPAARPTLEWRVGDDHGIRSAEVVLETVAAGRETAPTVIALVRPPDGGWHGRDVLPLTGELPVPLESLRLRKGDQVRLSVRATDERGAAAGQTTSSEVVVLDVTDEPGLLAALSESDERSARQLDAILERQLQVGGAPSSPGQGRTAPPTQPPPGPGTTP